MSSTCTFDTSSLKRLCHNRVYIYGYGYTLSLYFHFASSVYLDIASQLSFSGPLSYLVTVQRFPTLYSISFLCINIMFVSFLTFLILCSCWSGLHPLSVSCIVSFGSLSVLCRTLLDYRTVGVECTQCFKSTNLLSLCLIVTKLVWCYVVSYWELLAVLSLLKPSVLRMRIESSPWHCRYLKKKNELKCYKHHTYYSLQLFFVSW